VRVFFIILFLAQYSFADSNLVVKENCLPDSKSETLYSDDVKWGIELPDMLKLYKELYDSNKRLGKRAYLDPQTNSLVLPYMDFRGGVIKVSPQLIETIKNHIENAFRHEYIDAVFFPDMGHSHFLIPNEKWEKKYSGIPMEKITDFYEELFADPEVKFVYHTAEQLKTTDEKKQILPDRKLQWRFYTRNLIGENTQKGHVSVLPALDNSANTLGGLEGYFWYGAGFNLSANKNGCFTFKNKGQTFHFDISMFDLEPKNPVYDDSY
jgi:hypothetical protein